MSGSPKYTSAALAAAQAARLAQQRAERERERARKAEERRLAAEQAERDGMSAVLAALDRRIAALAGDAQAAGLAGRHTELAREARACGTAVSGAHGAAALSAARQRLTGLECAADELGAQAMAVLARRERGRALAATRATLAAVADRAELDRPGADGCAAQLAVAEAALSDQKAFEKAHALLAESVARHLATVRERRAELERARALAAAATAEIEAALADVAADAAEVEGVAAAHDLAGQLAAQARGTDAAAVAKLAQQTREQAARLATEHAAWADRMDRARLVIEAVTKALPEAGLVLDAGSLRYQGTSVSVRARRADGSYLGLAVIPDDRDGAEILYQSDGADTVVERTVDGVTATCDLTEELIEGLHAALAVEGVETGELQWEGKPATRPDRNESAQYWTNQQNERGSGR